MCKSLFSTKVFFLIVGSFLLPVCLAEEAKQESLLPNFIVIMVDDLGTHDLGCYGGTYIQTPNIDHLAREGVRATRAYAAASICSPTRAAWITGRHPARLGITDWIRAGFQRVEGSSIHVSRQDFDENPNHKFRTPTNPFYLPLEEITIAEILKERGYQTAHIGKWHLGDQAWYPEQQGYDINIGGCDYGQPPSFFDPFNQPKSKNEQLRNGIPGITAKRPGEFLTDRETSEAITLMRTWKNQPFYIQLNHYAVHTPTQAPEELTKQYRREGKTEMQAKYAALVQTVDDSVGRIRAALSELAIARPTIIVLTSDNGGLDQDGSPTDNAPLRDGKGSPYEGGLRVPFLLHCEQLFQDVSELSQPMTSLDWFPTVCELVASTKSKELELDGLSLLPLLSNQDQSIATRTLVWHFPHYRGATFPYSVIQRDDWKLIHHYETEPELFHLKDDPYEQHNLAKARPEIAQNLSKALFDELKRLKASLPQKK